MSASITNVINVSLLEGGAQAARDNMNVVMLITSQQTGPLSSANRYQIYRDSQSVATDFGTSSSVYAHALTFFGTQPNPTNAGGYLVVGYWRGASEDVAATAAVLEGAQISEATVIPQLQAIDDGTMDIDVDGVTENLTALDFQSSTDMDDVIGVLNAALAGATASFDNQSVVITSDTTGATSTITFATDPGTGTFVGDILAITDGSGATTTQGAAADTLTVETKLQGITELKGEVNFKGAVFIDNVSDSDAEEIAEWAQANDTLVYDVFSGASYLAVDPTNTVWSIKLSGYTNYRMLYSAANNRKMATSYMARAHTVNFSAINSALTMHLKELNVAAEEYSESDIASAKTVGLDLYTTIKNVPKLLTSGANKFTDERYNLIAYVDAIQTDLFNLLGGTATKIPQTRAGVSQMTDQLEQTTENFVTAGVFAPGAWSSPDYFGDLDTFNRSIEVNGYYVLANSLADQPQSERENRESPVLQVAVKGAGAIHSADVIINFNA